MPRYHSTATWPIAFELLERRFSLEPGAELDFPAEHAWLLRARQLPLAEGPSPLGASAPKARIERAAAPAPRPRPPVEHDQADTDEEPDEADEAPCSVPDDEEAALEASLAQAEKDLAGGGARKPGSRRPGRG